MSNGRGNLVDSTMRDVCVIYTSDKNKSGRYFAEQVAYVEGKDNNAQYLTSCWTNVKKFMSRASKWFFVMLKRPADQRTRNSQLKLCAHSLIRICSFTDLDISYFSHCVTWKCTQIVRVVLSKNLVKVEWNVQPQISGSTKKELKV